MSEIALAEINSFASPAPTADFIQALLGELQALREEVARLQEDNQDLRDRVVSLEKERDHASEQDLIQLRLIKELRDQIQPGPQPMQRDRGDILRALLAANDGKMLRSVARKKMHLSESRFSELLAVMGDFIEIKPFHKDERKKLLCLKVNKR